MKAIQANVLVKTTVVAALLALVSVIGFGTAYGYGTITTSSKGGGGSARTVTNTGGQVLGEEKFMFNMDLSEGMQNNDVKELQKRLRAEGFFTFSTDTGYFGPITLAAVKAYQAAHPSIGFVTGFVGPLTRAELNK